jgi:uncharacterized repeat protein (TIGR01451 family)
MTLWVTVDAELSEGALVVNSRYSAVADHLAPLIGEPPVTTTVRDFSVTISKTAWPDPVVANQQMLFTITVRNEGSLLEDVAITDLLPSGVTYKSCAPNQPPEDFCDALGVKQREVFWWLAKLQPDSSRQLVVRVLVDNVRSNIVENEHYGLRVVDGLSNRWEMGLPIAVHVVFRAYLPIVLAGLPP